MSLTLALLSRTSTSIRLRHCKYILLASSLNVAYEGLMPHSDEICAFIVVNFSQNLEYLDLGYTTGHICQHKVLQNKGIKSAIRNVREHLGLSGDHSWKS